MEELTCLLSSGLLIGFVQTPPELLILRLALQRVSQRSRRVTSVLAGTFARRCVVRHET